MRTIAQQKHAAHCRHAKSSEAKHLYWCELSNRFQSSLSAANLYRFVSSERRAICQRIATFQETFSLQLKPSTLQTWLREWQIKKRNI